MRIKSSIFFCTLIGIIFIISGCKTKHKLVYLNNFSIDSSNIISSIPSINLKVDDYISVYISDIDNETVSIFNSRIRNDNTPEHGYLIDTDGTITLPVIGKVEVVNLTKSEAEKVIANKLAIYLKNPFVQIQILNFRISVLGDVRNPGSFILNSQRISVLEAIGMAGDLKMTGMRKNVLVLRDVNGVKSEFRLDLTSKSIQNSPAFYLQQNDVVYVEPNFNSRLESTFLKSNGQIIISSIAPILSILILLRQ
jgi:polysaccharide export outer membrane protein